jgi:branched-chain amino acid transport system substrate-binding protein
MRRLVLIALLPLAACSFTTASSFNECDQTSDCASGRVCSQHFCVAVDCKESYGATDAGDAIVLGAAIPFTSPGGTEDQSERADFQAAVLALDEVNQRGIGGRKLALYACDTASDPTAPATSCTKA